MPLYENMQSQLVSRLSLREPISATGDTPLREAILRMRKGKLGCTIVVDDDQRPIGMFTESMLTQLLTHTSAAVDDPLDKHMADRWPWVKLNDPIVDVLDAMQTKNVRFLCVVDQDGRLVGLTGQKSFMEFVADHFPDQAIVKWVVSQRHPGRGKGND